MEMEIVGKEKALAEVNLDDIKRVLSKTWDFKKAVLDATRVISIVDQNAVEHLKLFIYFGLDWQRIFQAFKYKEHKPVMTVKLFTVKTKDWVRLRPGAVTQDQRAILLEEVREKDGEYVMLVQDYITEPSFAIKNFIDNLQFDYGTDNTWKGLV